MNYSNEHRNRLTACATWYGTLMGLFWIAKFLLVPLGMSASFLMFLFLGLSLCVPYVGFCMARSYRNRYCAGMIAFGEAWMFLFLVYIYASLLTALGYYIYFRFIDGGYMLNTLEEMVNDLLRTMPTSDGKLEMKRQMSGIIEGMRALSPITIAVQQMSQNLLLGALMALLTAPFVKRSRPVTNEPV